MEELRWPYNSRLYETIREIRREIPKLDFSGLHRTKTKPILARFLLSKPVKPKK